MGLKVSPFGDGAGPPTFGGVVGPTPGPPIDGGAGGLTGRSNIGNGIGCCTNLAYGFNICCICGVP